MKMLRGAGHIRIRNINIQKSFKVAQKRLKKTYLDDKGMQTTRQMAVDHREEPQGKPSETTADRNSWNRRTKRADSKQWDKGEDFRFIVFCHYFRSLPYYDS